MSKLVICATNGSVGMITASGRGGTEEDVHNDREQSTVWQIRVARKEACWSEIQEA